MRGTGHYRGVARPRGHLDHFSNTHVFKQILEAMLLRIGPECGPPAHLLQLARGGHFKRFPLSSRLYCRLLCPTSPLSNREVKPPASHHPAHRLDCSSTPTLALEPFLCLLRASTVQLLLPTPAPAGGLLLLGGSDVPVSPACVTCALSPAVAAFLPPPRTCCLASPPLPQYIL